MSDESIEVGLTAGTVTEIIRREARAMSTRDFSTSESKYCQSITAVSSLIDAGGIFDEVSRRGS